MMRSRKRLLDTIRNAINNNSPSSSTTNTARSSSISGNQQKNPLLRCFPIYENQIQYYQQPKSPKDFHQLLCERIRNAKFRVQIASLYVGCGDDCETELELLDSLRQHASTTAAASANNNNEVQVQILLDHSRALRKVKKNNNKTTKTTGSNNNTASTYSSSAQACYDALTMSSPSPSSSSSSSSNTNNNNNNNNNTNSTSSPPPPSNKVIKTGVHLFPVLPKILRRLLPSPFNEVAGVFHMKAYVIDNDILLSGANLSSEYFTTRIDRYLYIQNSSPITNWYSQLINVLCTYGAIQYNNNNDNDNDDDDNDDPESSCSTSSSSSSSTSTSRQEQLFQNLQSLLLDQGDQHDNNNSRDLIDDKDYQAGDPVAYAVPTFQLPQYYLDENCPPHSNHPCNYFRQDTAIWQSLFEKPGDSDESEEEDKSDDCSAMTTMRIASAYLNPTPTFLDNSNLCTSNIYLTAGQISHGFRSINKKRMKDWIPVSYQYAAKNEIIRSMNKNDSTHDDDDNNNNRVYYYHRPGWTFHAKGLWLSRKKCRSGGATTSKNNNHHHNNPSSSPLHFSQDDDIWLVSHGSGNFGYRSEYRDVESHLLLVLPPGQQSPLQQIVKTEWNDQLCDPQYALSNDPEEYDMNLSPSWLSYLYYAGRPFL